LRKTVKTNYYIGSLFFVIPLIFFIELYFFPLFSIFKNAFQFLSRELSINWQNIGNVFWFTLWQAIVSTLLTLLAGFPAAWIFSRFTFPGKKILNALFTIPFILPTVVTASAFNALLGPRGFINMVWMSMTGSTKPAVQLMNTIWIILLAHVFYNTSVVIRVIGNSWSQIDARLEDAAKTLGASPLQVFFRVVFPQLKPAILSACLLIFLFDFTSYGVVILLGGPKFRTIEVEIYYQALQMLNLPLSGILSIFQIVITIAVTLIDKRLSQIILINRAPRISGENMRKPELGLERIVIFLILFFQIIFLLSPILALFFRSLYIFPSESSRTALSPGWTSIYYQQLFINERNSIFFVPPIKAILNSLSIAVAASGISLLISLFIVVGENRYPWTGKLESVFMIPIGTSAVTLGLGYLLYFGRDIQKAWLIPFAHSLIALPFVIRSIKPAIFNIPNSLRQSAAILGASPIQVFLKIDFPIIFRGLINGFIFAFTISLGEFGATSFITRPDRPTIPIAIYRFLGQPGLMNYGQAMAMASILMTFCLIMIAVVDQKE
jgi:thiamine transport system permease protein